MEGHDQSYDELALVHGQDIFLINRVRIDSLFHQQLFGHLLDGILLNNSIFYIALELALIHHSKASLSELAIDLKVFELDPLLDFGLFLEDLSDSRLGNILIILI